MSCCQALGLGVINPCPSILSAVFALCECQQGQMFASGERAGPSYVGPHLQPPDVPAAPRCDESLGLAVVIWRDLVPLVPLSVPQSTPWPQAVRLDTGGLCSAT